MTGVSHARHLSGAYGLFSMAACRQERLQDEQYQKREKETGRGDRIWVATSTSC